MGTSSPAGSNRTIRVSVSASRTEQEHKTYLSAWDSSIDLLKEVVINL